MGVLISNDLWLILFFFLNAFTQVYLKFVLHLFSFVILLQKYQINRKLYIINENKYAADLRNQEVEKSKRLKYWKLTTDSFLRTDSAVVTWKIILLIIEV